MTEKNPLNDNSTCRQRFCYAFMCPPHGAVAEWTSLALCSLMVWGVLWSLTEDAALPGGNYFALLILVVCCVIAGELVTQVNLPPLLGKYFFL